MKKFIHINKNMVESYQHKKHGFKDPVIVVSTGEKASEHCKELKILGESKIVYSPTKPLDMQEELIEIGKLERVPRIKCWIETEANIEMA